ncbi:MAG: helix-turn-helix domain-containing protein [Candidatus Dormibacteria bacterium]
MNEAGASERVISRAVDRVCHLLWFLMRQEPEIRALAEEHQAMGFPHYLTSRMGVMEVDRWADEVFIAPRSLVEHLLPRCLALDPPIYVDLALAAAGRALSRLSPTPPPALMELAEKVEPEGGLVSAWAGWPRSGDPHRDAVRDAMVIREDRAHGHYRAAAEAGLAPLELLVLTQLWKGREVDLISKGFKWGEPDVDLATGSLQRRGLVEAAGSISGAGRSLREEIEEQTDRWAARYLPSLADDRRRTVAAELEPLGSI